MVGKNAARKVWIAGISLCNVWEGERVGKKESEECAVNRWFATDIWIGLQKSEIILRKLEKNRSVISAFTAAWRHPAVIIALTSGFILWLRTARQFPVVPEEQSADVRIYFMLANRPPVSRCAWGALTSGIILCLRTARQFPVVSEEQSADVRVYEKYEKWKNISKVRVSDTCWGQSAEKKEFPRSPERLAYLMVNISVLRTNNNRLKSLLFKYNNEGLNI